MTNAVAVQDKPDEVEWLTHSLPSLRHDPVARETARPIVAKLLTPADTAWTMARIAALLSPYYERDIPQAVRMMEAEDWAEALAQYPQWAIQNAVRWWKSEHNPDRRKRPMEGDIAARCSVEVGAVNVAKYYLDRDIVIVKPRTEVAREPVLDVEEKRAIAKRIMAEVFKRENQE